MKKKKMPCRLGVLLMTAALLVSTVKIPVTHAADTDLKDTVPPVIQKVEFAQNNTTLHPGDTVSIKIYADDQDSGMERAYATVYMTGAGDEFQQNPSTTEYNGEEKSFTLTWVIPETYHTLGTIGELGVSDKDGNIAEWKVKDEQQQSIYQYKIAGKEVVEEGFEVKDFKFGNGQSIMQGANLQFSFQLVKKDENAVYPELVRLNFKSGQEESTVSYYAQHKGDGVYVHDFEIDKGAPLLKWTLAEIKCEDSGDPITFDGKENVWFEVVEGNWDDENPVITSITVDKNGETVKAGDKVHVEMKATDNVALDKESASAHFNTGIKLDLGEGWEVIHLNYDESKQAFVGDFEITADTYPCEWYISFNIEDEEGNAAYMTDYDPDFEMQYPYYFYVANAEGVTPAVYKQVRIFVETVDKDGNIDSSFCKEYQNVERRTTLRELGFQFPETAETYEGKKFVGWKVDNRFESKVTGDWQIVNHHNLGLDSYDLRIVPIYEENGVCNHEWVKSNTKAPTCTEEGYTEYTCNTCQSTKKDDITEKVPHTPEDVTDCTVATKCTECGTVVREAGEHTYDEGVVTVEPTCLEKGEKEFACTVCGHVKTEEIAAKGHAWKTTTTEEAIITKCDVCGEEQKIAFEKKEGIDVSFSNDVYTYLLENGYKDLVLETEEVKADELEEAQKEALAALGEDVKLVELTLKAVVYGEDGEIVEETVISKLGGEAVVKVAYEAPKDMDGKVVKVCYLAEDGKVEEMTVSYKDGTATFATTHFSTYAVYTAEKTEDTDNGQTNPPKTDDTSKTNTPKTGDASNWMLWAALICVSVVTGSAAYKKRMR